MNAPPRKHPGATPHHLVSPKRFLLPMTSVAASHFVANLCCAFNGDTVVSCTESL